jgi:nucleoside-diphosphate-sugar epimerase
MDVAQRVAVTGAAGFIGSAVVASLRASGREVVEVDLPGVDITDAAAVGRALAGCDAVVHTAAIVGEFPGMERFVRTNVVGTRNVLDAIGGGRAVCLTSVAVWGYDFRSDVSEDSPPRPCGNPYIDTKGAAETLALLRGATCVRPGDVYGPRSGPWVIRPLEAMRRRLFALPGRGEGIITPVYVDDLVDGIIRALDTAAAAGRAYTLWDGEPVTAADFFAHHAEWLGQSKIRCVPRPLAILGAALPGNGTSPAALRFVSRRAVYPNTRAREELGWQPRVGLAEGMARTREWAAGAGLLGK